MALITKLFPNLLFAQAQDRPLRTPQEPSPLAAGLVTSLPTSLPLQLAREHPDRQIEAPRLVPLLALHTHPPQNSGQNLPPPCSVLGFSTAETKLHDHLYIGGLLICLH